MDCLHTALACCFRQKLAPHDILWHGSARSVALLIVDFPRYRSSEAFSELMYLLRQHGAKCTFLVPWDRLKALGIKTSMYETMRAINIEGHEVALHFRQGICGRSNTQLRQDAVEALHFLQRVYGITVVSAKVGRPLTADHKAFESLGLTVVDGVPNQVVVEDTDDVLMDTAMVLEAVRGQQCVCVRDVR